MKANFSFLHRSLVFAYGVASYAVSFATFGYIAGFIGNFIVPKPLDSPATAPFWTSLLVNIGLVAVFAIQHSVMARPAFKRWWTSIIPQAAERSTYVLFSCLALLALFVFWQPMGGTIWEVKHEAGRAALYTLYALGWVLLFASTFFINHFDLMGLRQVWLHLRGRRIHRSSVRHACALSHGAASPLCRLVPHLLGDTDDDRRTPRLCPGYHRLHSHGDSLGRAGSCRGTSAVRGVSPARPDVHPAPANGCSLAQRTLPEGASKNVIVKVS
jgi:protein-S-isoprenylcysteine O-methyltransferase Ste14